MNFSDRKELDRINEALEAYEKGSESLAALADRYKIPQHKLNYYRAKQVGKAPYQRRREKKLATRKKSVPRLFEVPMTPATIHQADDGFVDVTIRVPKSKLYQLFEKSI